MSRHRTKYELKNGVYQPILLEEHVVTEIMDRLAWAKIRVDRIRERIPGKGRLSTAGIPDLMGRVVKDGRAIPLCIEVKRPGGIRRVAQERWIAEAKADGCIAFFAESWQDVADNLKAAGIDLKYEVEGKR